MNISYLLFAKISAVAFFVLFGCDNSKIRNPTSDNTQTTSSSVNSASSNSDNSALLFSIREEPNAPVPDNQRRFSYQLNAYNSTPLWSFVNKGENETEILTSLKTNDLNLKKKLGQIFDWTWGSSPSENLNTFFWDPFFYTESWQDLTSIKARFCELCWKDYRAETDEQGHFLRLWKKVATGGEIAWIQVQYDTPKTAVLEVDFYADDGAQLIQKIVFSYQNNLLFEKQLWRVTNNSQSFYLLRKEKFYYTNGVEGTSTSNIARKFSLELINPQKSVSSLDFDGNLIKEGATLLHWFGSNSTLNWLAFKLNTGISQNTHALAEEQIAWLLKIKNNALCFIDDSSWVICPESYGHAQELKFTHSEFSQTLQLNLNSKTIMDWPLNLGVLNFSNTPVPTATKIATSTNTAVSTNSGTVTSTSSSTAHSSSTSTETTCWQGTAKTDLDVQNSLFIDFPTLKNKQGSSSLQSLKETIKVMCLTQYTDSSDSYRTNWYQLLTQNINNFAWETSENCSSNEIAYVEISPNASADSTAKSPMHLCPLFEQQTDAVDKASTLMHESRHGSHRGWWTGDFQNVFLGSILGDKTFESYLTYFQNNGTITNQRYTNTSTLRGFIHSPCDDNFKFSQTKMADLACDPVFIPFQNNTRAAELGGGAYGYDVYFYSRLASASASHSHSARQYACQSGYSYLLTRFARYLDVNGSGSSAQPSNALIQKLFDYCLE